jgi:type IV pilus assembly protein PilE
MNKQSSGFTLIEVMVVVAVISVLAAIAIPSYQEYVLRANRSDAQDKLAEVAFEQERFANRNRRYTLDMTELGYAADPVASSQGLYDVDAQVCAGANVRTCVILTATPRAGTAQAADGPLTLDTRGIKTGNW